MTATNNVMSGKSRKWGVSQPSQLRHKARFSKDILYKLRSPTPPTGQYNIRPPAGRTKQKVFSKDNGIFHDQMHIPWLQPESNHQWGVVALWLERKTLIYEVLGSSSESGISAPQIRGLDESATGIGQANPFQLKSDLHLGKFSREPTIPWEHCTTRFHVLS